MILLSARGLSRQFDGDPIFRDVTFDVRLGERIGLVGPNGTGKTTLLYLLMGVDDPDTGQIDRNSAARIGYLEQHAEFPPELTLRQEAQRGLQHLYELQQRAERLAAEMAQASADKLPGLQRQYDTVQHDLERLDAYHIEHRIDEVLTGLGFDESEYDRPLQSFSGGQQNRALLARLLLESPELMLLDEPTNHLDIAATEWLEDYLSRTRQAVLLVSHDRYFLDKVTNRTLELFAGKLSDYRGSFSAYWEQRQERLKVLERTQQKQQEFVERTEDFIRRNKYGQKHAQASDREKKLARVETVELPDDFQSVHMSFGDAERTGDWVLEATDVSKGFGEPLFRDVTLQIERGDRLGLLGPNGCGKTTLLRTLIGELQPDTGQVRVGTNVNIGYFDQQLASVDPQQNAVDAVRPANWTEMSPGEARGLLARFGIRGDLALQQVGLMSGGERSKVALARLAAQKVNVLVLDEPTNHLDLWARDGLEQALHGFGGTLIFVSHDRYFLDQVASRVLVLEANDWHLYDGNYSDYLQFRANNRPASERAAEPRPEASQNQSSNVDEEQSPERRRRQFAYRKVEDIELEIAEHEELLERLQAELSDPATHRDADKVRQTMARFEETQSELQQLYLHWEEAMELN